MPVRIIFRGSILFDLRDDKLRALLINRPGREGVHDHRAGIALIGRDPQDTKHDPEGRALRGVAYGFDRDVVTLNARGMKKGGITADASFHDHIPKLRALLPPDTARPTRFNDSLISGEVIVPSGTIRAGRMASWKPLDRDRVATLRFMRMNGMDFFYFGHCADETIVEVADEEVGVLEIRRRSMRARAADRGGETHDHGGGDSGNGGSIVSSRQDDQARTRPKVSDMPELLTALTTLKKPREQTRFEHESDPGWVDVLVTNFPPQRVKPIPWGMHFQMLFEAAGYDPLRFHDLDQVTFMKRARDYDEEEWKLDERHLQTKGFPFPFISGSRGEILDLADEGALPALEPLRALQPEDAVAPPMSPENRPVCLQGCEFC